MEVKDATDAEDRAKKLIREKRPKLRQILFKRVEKKDNSWLIEGEIWFKRLYLFTVKKFFKLQISSETGEATSYQETHFKVWFPGPHA